METQQKYRFDFIGNRMAAFVVSVVLIVLGIGSIAYKGGINFGVDFVGGTLVEVQFSDTPDIDAIRKAVGQANFASASIQKLGEENLVLIRAQVAQNAGESGEDEGKKITNALQTAFEEKSFEIKRVEQIGPQVGSELWQSAQTAMLFMLAGMVLYISWRFESKFALPVAIIAVVIIGLSSWESALTIVILLGIAAVLAACVYYEYHYAFAAIIALMHDALITVGALSLTDRELTLPIVAAILTIIGYSVNDTIVVFDRIRENLRLMAREKPEDIMNASINQTLSRTILTSLTTLFVVVVLYVAGGHVINSFAFALLVGITVGTYSSIFVATPILYIWNQQVKGGIFKKA